MFLSKKTNLNIRIFYDTILILTTRFETNISLKPTKFLIEFDELINNVNVGKFDPLNNRLFICRLLFSRQLSTN